MTTTTADDPAQHAYETLLAGAVALDAVRENALGEDLVRLTALAALSEVALILNPGAARGCDGCGVDRDPEIFDALGYSWAEDRDADGDVLVSICPLCRLDPPQEVDDEPPGVGVSALGPDARRTPAEPGVDLSDPHDHGLLR